MDMVLSFIEENRSLPGLRDLPSSLATLMLTPRFKASRHVVFLVFEPGGTQPILVAKIPRMPQLGDKLAHEARVLETVQSLRRVGFDSIPRIVAYRDRHGYPILLETALNGPLMSPDLVRKSPELMVQITRDWLLEVQSNPTRPHDELWYTELVESPLSYLRNRFPLTQEECELLERCGRYLEVLKGVPLPYVLEHGDLSHPNIIMTQSDSIGVIDWELATIHGLFASDFFIFLSYVTFSLAYANESGEYLRPFEKAFFDNQTWVQPHIQAFTKGLDLPASTLPSLFLLCWLRYLVQFIERLHGHKTDRVNMETAAVVRSNRYYAIWKYTIEHYQNLAIQ